MVFPAYRISENKQFIQQSLLLIYPEIASRASLSESFFLLEWFICAFSRLFELYPTVPFAFFASVFFESFMLHHHLKISFSVHEIFTPS
jgi:hypothetical protein